MGIWYDKKDERKEDGSVKTKLSAETTSASLHIMAMAFMLCDHLWATVVPGNDWLTCIGRIAFPIFAFLAVEGYFHTSSLKKYVGRLALTAAISELPFNLMMGSSLIYPVHQNVIWTLLLGIAAVHLNEKAKVGKRRWVRVLTAAGTILFGFILGLLTMVDYLHAGVLTLLVFYFFRGGKWWQRLGQLVCLYYLNVEVLSGFAYEVTLFGTTHYLVRQGLALLALIPIWFYRGRQGYHSRAFRYFCYGFYPVHMLLLALARMA